MWVPSMLASKDSALQIYALRWWKAVWTIWEPWQMWWEAKKDAFAQLGMLVQMEGMHTRKSSEVSPTPMSTNL